MDKWLEDWMKQYKQTYFDYFGYGPDDFVPSEISGGRAVDIHHIKPRGRGGSDDIGNLMAVPRGEHRLIHDVGHYTEDYLRQVHEQFLKDHERVGKGER